MDIVSRTFLDRWELPISGKKQSKAGKTSCLKINKICYFLFFGGDSRHVQVAIYTVFDEESESEVKKCKILEPGKKKIRKTDLKPEFSIFFSVFGHNSGP